MHDIAAGDAQHLPGARPVEHDAQRRDIAVGTGLLIFDLYAGDHAFKLRLGQARRAGSAMGASPEHLLRPPLRQPPMGRSEEPTSDIQSLMRISYAVF